MEKDGHFASCLFSILETVDLGKNRRKILIAAQKRIKKNMVVVDSLLSSRLRLLFALSSRVSVRFSASAASVLRNAPAPEPAPFPGAADVFCFFDRSAIS